MSATISALEDDALLVCHLIADFRSHIVMLSRTRVGIRPSRGSGIFAQKIIANAQQLNCERWPLGGWQQLACASGPFFYTSYFVPIEPVSLWCLISHPQYNLGGKALYTIRKTRRCHNTNLAESPKCGLSQRRWS